MRNPVGIGRHLGSHFLSTIGDFALAFSSSFHCSQAPYSFPAVELPPSISIATFAPFFPTPDLPATDRMKKRAKQNYGSTSKKAPLEKARKVAPSSNRESPLPAKFIGVSVPPIPMRSCLRRNRKSS